MFKLMPKVAFINCPPWDTRMPHLGIGYLSSSLKKNKISNSFFDINLDLYHFAEQKDKRFWEGSCFYEWSEKRLHKYFFSKYCGYLEGYAYNVLKSNPGYACFSINPTNKEFSLSFIDKLKAKKPEMIIIAGGPLIKHEFNELKNKNIDYLIIGEGDNVLPELVNNLDSAAKQAVSLSGKISQGKIIHANPVDINTLNYPTYEVFDLNKYTTRTMPILASRGCYGKCNFCIDWKGNPFRVRDHNQIYEEIIYHIKKNKTYFFNFNDLLLNGDMGNINKLCDMLIANKVKLGWAGVCSLNKNLIKSAKKLSMAGCLHLSFGIESFSPKMVALMNKPYSPKAYFPVFAALRKNKITIGINQIVGFPGETEKDFEESLKKIKSLKGSINYVTSINPAYVTGDSNLNMDPEKFKIKFPKKDRSVAWATYDNTNNLKIRVKRIERLLKLLWKLKIPAAFPDNSLVRRMLRLRSDKPLVLLIPPYSENFSKKDRFSMLIMKSKNAEIFEFGSFLEKNADKKLLGYTRKKASFWMSDNIIERLHFTNFFFCVEIAKEIIKIPNPKFITIILNKYNRYLVYAFIMTIRRFSNIPILIAYTVSKKDMPNLKKLFAFEDIHMACLEKKSDLDNLLTAYSMRFFFNSSKRLLI